MININNAWRITAGDSILRLSDYDGFVWSVCRLENAHELCIVYEYAICVYVERWQ